MKCDVFQPDQFTDEPYFSAREKASFANHFAVFVHSGFSYKHWPQWFYERLSRLFGFIAHFNSEGFWHNYFSTTLGKVEFLLQCTGGLNNGDWYFDEVELTIRDWILDNQFTNIYIDSYALEEEEKERKELLRLLQRYGIPEEYKEATSVPVNATVEKTAEPNPAVKVIQASQPKKVEVKSPPASLTKKVEVKAIQASQPKKVEVQLQPKTTEKKFLLPDSDR